jgi:hypothetical protein
VILRQLVIYVHVQLAQKSQVNPKGADGSLVYFTDRQANRIL